MEINLKTSIYFKQILKWFFKAVTPRLTNKNRKYKKYQRNTELDVANSIWFFWQMLSHHQQVTHLIPLKHDPQNRKF